MGDRFGATESQSFFPEGIGTALLRLASRMERASPGVASCRRGCVRKEWDLQIPDAVVFSFARLGMPEAGLFKIEEDLAQTNNARRVCHLVARSGFCNRYLSIDVLVADTVIPRIDARDCCR